MSAEFVHLNIHTEYSVVDSTLRIPQIMEALKGSESPAVGITDFNNMYAALKFYKAATGAGIKPLLGAEVLVHFSAGFTGVNPGDPDAADAVGGLLDTSVARFDPRSNVMAGQKAEIAITTERMHFFDPNSHLSI